MFWTTFHCEEPDFVVRSIPDGVQFGVQRARLESSEVFRDMFACCEMGFDMVTHDHSDQHLDLDEPAGILTVLLHILHNPPPAPVLLPPDGEHGAAVSNSAIPLPLLPLLFRLSDKYAFPDGTMQNLHLHLQAHALLHPFKVYGLAMQLGLRSIATETSKYLLHPPLSSYTTEEMQAIPSVEAYHKLVQLHAFRVERLRELLLGEAIFPHGYGACSAHRDQTSHLWNERKKDLAYRIEPATDVAGEMAVLSGRLRSCRACYKACTAAVEMLAYKCQRVAKRVDIVPDEE